MTPAAALSVRRTGGSAAARAALLGVLAAVAGGCAYYNGVYNAKASAHAADKLARRGRLDEAAGPYAVAAEKAETVLARYPRSRWRPEALFIAGRSEAMIGRCEGAARRLGEFLALPRQPGARRDRAALALASCEVRSERFDDARRLLEPLVRSKNREIAAEASLWMARSALALGANDEAARWLAAVPPGAAQWELASASLERREYARAESLIVLRARRGDYRDEVLGALRELWAAKRYDGVERIVTAYDGARTPIAAKITLDLAAADLLIAAARDSAARAHLQRAQGLAVDTLRAREVAARLCLLQLAGVSLTADAEAVISRASQRAAGAPMFDRLRDNLLLVKLLEQRTDYTGASLFLAGEVARDSLRAPRLAHALFARVASTMATTPIAPKALLAAAVVMPDSAAVYKELVRERYPRSPYALLLAGDDPSDSPQYQQVEDGLRRGWESGVALLADTLSKLRPTPTAGGATGVAAGDSARAGPGAAGTGSGGTARTSPPAGAGTRDSVLRTEGAATGVRP